MKGRIIAFSGTHGTGKTTAAFQEARNQKFQHPDKSVKLLHDLEADCPYPINQEASEHAQTWLFSHHILQEISALHRFDIVVIDRSIIDVIGYTMALGYESRAKAMYEYARTHVPLYRSITFKRTAYNRHCHADGIRSTNPGFRQKVEDSILTLQAGLLQPSIYPGRTYFA